jgi:Fic family protein
MITRPPKTDSLSVLASAFSALVAGPEVVDAPTVGDRYRHWHTLRLLKPPEGLTHEQWWHLLKLRRQPRVTVPLTSTGGQPFFYVQVDPTWRHLHEIDSKAGAHVATLGDATGVGSKERYLMSSLEEEAITSSMLEGAVTTRRQAKEILESGRKPRTTGERMVVNNFRAITWLRELRADPLTPDLVLELHRRMTEGTLDDADGAGRLRRAEEDIVLRDLDSDDVVHRPPPAAELAGRLEDLCKWANDDAPEPFVHPIVRSIVLHFWLAYDHPFVDGNGRTARALFYWSMLRRGYWLAEYLPISRLFLAAPGRYARAFQYVETDEGDLTYFILFHLGILSRAFEDLKAYLKRKADERGSITKLLRASVELNHRQVDLLTRAVKDPDAQFSIDAHRASHGVVYQTARTDLLDLERRGLLLRRKVGKRYVFLPAKNLESRLKRLR